MAAEVVDGCLATRLRLATRVITKLYDDALRPHGITVAQMALLAVAARGGGVARQAEVRGRLQMDDSTLSRNLERMRANGWMALAPEADSRVHSHRITPAGEALLERVTPAWRAAQGRAAELLGAPGVAFLHAFSRSQGFEG